MIKSKVYDEYWKFACERQNIFFNRINQIEPLTIDPILQQYKFTNCYRASDRVSQFLIRNVIYSGDQDPKEVFFRTILFKIFNKIETWKRLKNYLNSQLGIELSAKDFLQHKHNYIVTLSHLSMSEAIYSGAYIMPSGTKHNFGKCGMHLDLLERMLKDDLPQKIVDSESLNQVYELLLSYPTIGPFLAYQYSIDLNYSNIIHFDENDFVVPGPGCKSGIKKCFSNLGPYESESYIIQYMVVNQKEEFKRLGLDFKNLFGRDLKLIDCQNLFCEIDKYSRLKFPDVKGIGERKKIKQKFKINKEKIDYIFPPKWNLKVN